MEIKKLFGEKVKYFRKNKGYSQEKLAKESGLHRTYIGMIERGEKNICLENILKVSNALDLEAKFLFDFQNNEKKN